MNILQKIEALSQVIPSNTAITSIRYESAGTFATDEKTFTDLPAFVRVALLVTPSAQSKINVEVWLPENWNGVFIARGNGGMAGAIPYHTLAEGIRSGYAVAQTDMGTANGRTGGIGNPEVWKDFGWRATYFMSVIGKQLVCAFYETNQFKSYFYGTSTGGQQALAMAQRFPEYYDGIIAGVPANNRTHLHTYFLWNHIHLRTPAGECLFTNKEIEDITDTAVAFYQQCGDGETGDTFITAPKATPEIIEAFLSFLSQRFPHFSHPQLCALRSIYTGPVDPVTHRRIYNGMPMGSEKYDCGIRNCQAPEAPHFYPFLWAFGSNYNGRDFDFNNDMQMIDDCLAEDLNANDINLDAFFARGGKLFLYSGTADPCVPFPDAVGYVQRLARRYDNLSDSCRYFLIPGHDHGANIFRYGSAMLNGNIELSDNISVIRKWCEDGLAPDCFDFLPTQHSKGYRRLFAYSTSPDSSADTPACSDHYLMRKAKNQ